MTEREQVLELAASIECRLARGGSLDAIEARLCVEGLLCLADNERLFEVAAEIERTIGLPWHEGKVIRTARRIVSLYQADDAEPAQAERRAA